MNKRVVELKIIIESSETEGAQLMIKKILRECGDLFYSIEASIVSDKVVEDK